MVTFKMHREKAQWETTQDCYKLFGTNPGSNTLKTAATWPLTSLLKNHPSQTNNIWDTAGEIRTNLLVTFLYGPLHMDMPLLANQQELIYIISVQTQDVAWMICQEGWMERERESQ